MKKQWADMSREEKREERFREWLEASDTKFDSPAAAISSPAGPAPPRSNRKICAP